MNNNTKHFDLQLFGAGENVNTTNGTVDTTGGLPTGENGLSKEMKTYYADYLIDNAEPNLIHDQFAQKHAIPRNGGKTIQFRKYDPLPKLTAELSEGVTPTGQTLNMSVVDATVRQYGGYVEFSDLLLLSAIDNNLLMATKLLGSQAGRTLDTITREVLCGGTNVQYGAGDVSARYLLVGGKESGNNYMSVECIKRAVRFLKNQNAEKINGAYACIIHPDCAYDLTSDPNWKYPHQYADTKELYEGEIGMIEGVRFVESTEAKVFHAPDLMSTQRNIAVPQSGYTYLDIPQTADVGVGSGSFLMVRNSDDIGIIPTAELIGRSIIVHDVSANCAYYAVVTGIGKDGTGEHYVFLDRPLTVDNDGETPIPLSQGGMIYPGEAGFAGRDVYVTLVLGDNAYGTTELTGGGLEHIVKQLGSAGTADPLNQRATVGWKATKVATRLVEAFMVRIETASTFEVGEN